MDKQSFIREAKRIEEDCIYSSKGHFNASAGWSHVHYWLGIPTTIMAAVAGASALSKFDDSEIVAGVLSIAVAALSAVSTFLNPQEKVSLHHRAGNNYNCLKNKARIFYEVEVSSLTDPAVLTAELKKLDSERCKLNKESPLIPESAFRKAQKGVEDGEAKYKVD